MKAFVETDAGIFKIYDMGDDWKIIGPRFERWFSVWKADKSVSLRRAIDAIPGNHIHTEFC